MTLSRHYFLLLLFSSTLVACSSSVDRWTSSDDLKPDDQLSEADLNIIEFGIDFHEIGDFERARESYFEVLEENPNSSLTLYQIAYAYSAEGDMESCISYAGRGAQIDSEGRADALHMLGVCLDMSGRTEEAMEVFHEGARLLPENHLFQYSLSISAIRLGDAYGAIDYLEKALELNPEHAGSHFLLASIHKDLSHYYAAWIGFNYFLLFELGTPRADEAKNHIRNLLTPDSTVDEKGVTNVQLNIGNLLNLDSPMTYADLMFGLGLTRNLIDDKENEKTELNALNAQYEGVFKIAENLPGEQEGEGVLWETYVPFFTLLQSEGHTEALVYIFFEDSQIEGMAEWLNGNEKKVEEFRIWMQTRE